MMLKSFGCSFIFGTDLTDDVSSNMFDWSCNGLYIRPSRLTWPALLAKDINYEYKSLALPSIGNLQILESILKEIAQSNNDLFVIQWTWIDRFDFERQDRNEKQNFWDTILPNGTDRNSQWYFKNIHSQYRDKLTTLTYIKTAVDALQQNNIPFVMTNIDDLVFENIWHCNDGIAYLQNYLKPYFIDFEGLSFLEWTKKKGFPLSETLHPMDAAHRAAFELIKSYNLV